MFVDSVRIKLLAGKGGDGAASFRHEKFRPKGGPDGGDGGDGGDIVLTASRNQDTLAAFRYKKLLKAENGSPGSKAKKHGRSGQDLEIMVPVGTVVSSPDGEVYADLTRDGQSEIIAAGGHGGYGNAHFVSSTRQAPRVAEKGEDGEELDVSLELKMIADVGIVGLPNAGKSTFLSVVSSARPEIANYPFTTLRPNLGMADIDSASLLIADIPGLIEGAHKGKGLGDDFLRHIERTSVLLHLIDIYNDDPVKAYQTITGELKNYKIDLSKKPQIVALTKIEGIAKDDLSAKVKELKKAAGRGTPVLALSSQSGQGIKPALRELKKQADKSRAARSKAADASLPVIGLKPDINTWKLERQGDNFLVTGSKIERFARRTDFADFHGQERLRDIMRKMGIFKELNRQGAKSDQALIIGQPEIGRLTY